MSEGFQFYDIILFALIAIFIILRLRAVLGRRTGHERQRHADSYARSNDPSADGRGNEAGGKVVRLRDRGGPDERANRAPESLDAEFDEPIEPEDEPVEEGLQGGLTQIRRADPDFSPRRFVDGAKMAFEMIVEAFAKGDTATLRPLLGDDVYDEFAATIRDRLEANLSQETTIVSLDEGDIVDASLRGSTARVIVKFVSQQINVTRDKAENIVDGNESQIERVTDIWTFARNTRASDPNWHLVETSAPH